MANVMSLKKLKNKTSRNGFDLSKRNIFSAKVGELLPVYCKEVIPGDKFKINVKSFTRTMPVNTAAYTRIKEYYDWFFVPTNLLWNKFNTFVTQMVDNNQHASGPNSSLDLGQQHPYFDLQTIYDGLKYAYEQYIEVDQSYNPYMNMFGFNRALLSAKLLDYLGYSDMTSRLPNLSTGQYATNPALNPFPLLAYQKIYSDYYRDSQWEKAAAETFNIDYMNASPSATGSFQYALPMSSVFNQYYAGRQTMLDLRYVNWNKDLFMGVKPNSQFGDAASVIIGSEVAPTFGDGPYTVGNIKANSFSSSSYGTVQVSSQTGNLFNPSSVDGENNFNYSISRSDLKRLHQALGLSGQGNYYDAKFSILALRQAEALQKWKEITQSQQQDYKAQIEAHFGVSLSDAYSERCHYVDGFSDVIDINEVVNTNLVQDGNQLNAADIAGKGIGVNDGYTSFSSDVHGYLMCIYHAVPLLDYSLETRIPRQNLKTQVTDYAIPEFDKIGMVQVPFIEMSNDIELYDDQYQLLGYAPRYYDYKTDVDEIHGSARNRNSAWVAPFDDAYLKSLLYHGNLNGTPKPIDWQFFKVNPAILDSIFVASARVDSSTDSDQLLTNCMFDVKCVRNLDYDGLPY